MKIYRYNSIGTIECCLTPSWCADFCVYSSVWPQVHFHWNWPLFPLRAWPSLLIKDYNQRVYFWIKRAESGTNSTLHLKKQHFLVKKFSHNGRDKSYLNIDLALPRQRALRDWWHKDSFTGKTALTASLAFSIITLWVIYRVLDMMMLCLHFADYSS